MVVSWYHLGKIIGHGLIYSKIDKRQRKGGRTMIDLEYIIHLWYLCPADYRQTALQLLRENAPVLESKTEQTSTTE